MDSQLQYLNNHYESPDWYKDALLETEKKVVDGKEKIIDWNQAKIY